MTVRINYTDAKQGSFTNIQGLIARLKNKFATDTNKVAELNALLEHLSDSTKLATVKSIQTLSNGEIEFINLPS